MSVLEHALRIAQSVPVFPCLENKSPACKHGFKAASRDPELITELWRKSPGPLIGMPTGTTSGYDVLDIDPRHGGDTWLAEFVTALPITRIHHTRSGGKHFFFRHAEGVKNTASKLAPGIDTRGDGGYVILWHAHGCKSENIQTIDHWPQWLLRLLVKPPATRPPPPLPATRIEAEGRAAIMIQRAFDRVANAIPGHRHSELRAAAATLGGLSRFLTLGHAEVERRLVELIMATGAENQRNAERTAHWAISKGSYSPLLQGHNGRN